MRPNRDRLAAHARVSAALSGLSDVELTALMGSPNGRRVGIGGSTHAIHVAGEPVFVKLVRVTDAEHAAGPNCTENLFALPPCYQYGVGEGSTGFSVWREVAAHEAANDWVRNGECDNFPLLHHWRELPQQRVGAATADPFGIERAVRFWHGSPAVETRLEALAESRRVVALFLEHFPHPLRPWFTAQLTAGPSQAEAAVTLIDRQLLTAVAHMRSRGMIHFDAHFDNVLTDGHRIYLSDFGLATSRAFQLDRAERESFGLTSDHDLAYCASALVNIIVSTVLDVADPGERNDFLRRCSLSGHAPDLDGVLGDTVVRYAGVATIVNDFYWQLFDGDLTADYPAAALAGALDRAGVASW